MTREMIKKPGKPPQMRSKGATTRGLVPFAVQCAMELAEKFPCTHNTTVLHMVSSLLDFCVLLGLTDWGAPVV